MVAQLMPPPVSGLPIDLLVESPTNPRTVFRGLDELAVSIRAQGILEPLLVRLSQANGRTDRYEIIAGARRFRAAKLAKLASVPAIVCTMSDEQVLEAQLVENLQRDDMAPIDEARGYRRLRDEAKLSVEAIAQRIGKSTEHVYARLKLLELGKKPSQALAEGKISAEQGVLLARLPEADQRRGLERCTNEHDPMTVRELRHWVKERDDQNKTQQRVQGEVSRAKAAGEKVVHLCNSLYDHPPAGTLKPDAFAVAGKAKCDHLARGFVLDDVWTGQKREWLYTGKSLKVCTSPATCAVHKAKAPKVQRRVKTAAEKAAELRERAQEIARQQAITQIAARARPATLRPALLAETLIRGCGWDTAEQIMKRHGWKITGWDKRGGLIRQLRKMKADAVPSLIVELVISGDDDMLAPLAKATRVDVKKLERQALAALKKKKAKR